MAYSGVTYSIVWGKAGLNYNTNVDSIPENALVWPSRNINLNNGGLQKRGGTSKINGTVIADAPRLMGIYDFLKVGGSQFIVFTTADGKIWKNANTTIKTGLGATKHSQMEMFDNELFISNGYNVPQTWDGSAGSTSDLSSIPSDWTGTNYPAYIVRHGRGNSERMWAFGCPSKPYNIYVTPNGSGKDFSDANVTTLTIDTGDGFGIVGGVVFSDKLLMLGRKDAFIIDDSDTSTSNWGYFAVPWKGGVAHHRLIIKTPNDIVCMAEDGEVYSVIAAEQYGDYTIASITKDSFMHRWIQDNVRLSYISHFHGVYDPIMKAVKIFVVRTGQTTVDTCLVYFVENGLWMVHDNQSSASGYSASCSALIRVSAGDYEIYTGDYSGFIWHLEQSAKNDGDNLFACAFKTPPLEFGNRRISKMFNTGRLVMTRQAAEVMTIDWSVDGVAQTAVTVTAVAGQTDYSFNLGKVGEVLQYSIANNVKDVDFFVRSILTDFKLLGDQSE